MNIQKRLQIEFDFLGDEQISANTALKIINDVFKESESEQLTIGGVGSSSDLIVVELSDNEIKLITKKELKQWQKDALDFDGFEGWLVRGRLVK
ncbi:hypothetical protein [Seonamhaeicola sp.]|uniref:hypothetical protein n=1 Tax=Seonamhaeicola sp. TaxID=1912245 RepID=UPI0035661206